jgi:hypothetical protein
VPRAQAKYKRQNTRLESEGAEFLVLGNLLTEGIDAYKSYRYMVGYDVVAVSPENNSTARIQVKSRWASDALAWLIKDFDCDFVIFVKLNRGFRYKYNLDRSRWSEGKAQPECYVFPSNVVRKHREKNSKWGRVVLKKIPNYQEYRERWDLIRAFLKRRK